jgi:hypothetical protein
VDDHPLAARRLVPFQPAPGQLEGGAVVVDVGQQLVQEAEGVGFGQAGSGSGLEAVEPGQERGQLAGEDRPRSGQ